MTDRIMLQNLRFDATHGYHDYEQRIPQPFEVDVELRLNLQPAGIDDDLTKTIDYGRVYSIVQRVMESTTFRLLEALAEAISHEILAEFEVVEVGVRIRKPAVNLGGPARMATGSSDGDEMVPSGVLGGHDCPPSRTFVPVASWPMEFDIEIECIAVA